MLMYCRHGDEEINREGEEDVITRTPSTFLRKPAPAHKSEHMQTFLQWAATQEAADHDDEARSCWPPNGVQMPAVRWQSVRMTFKRRYCSSEVSVAGRGNPEPEHGGMGEAEVTDSFVDVHVEWSEEKSGRGSGVRSYDPSWSKSVFADTTPPSMCLEVGVRV